MRFRQVVRGNNGGMEDEPEQVDESGRNPTQQRIDEEGPEDRPVDIDWDENEPSPHQGEEGSDPAA
jgi:hypothetical protein